MNIAIRETRGADVEAVAALLRHAGLWDADFTGSRFRKMLKRNPGCCVAVHRGAVVGSVFATHDGACCGYIRKIAVAEGYRRRGVASKLVKAPLAALEDAGISVVFAHVKRANRPSAALLVSLGFAQRTRHDIFDRGFNSRFARTLRALKSMQGRAALPQGSTPHRAQWPHTYQVGQNPGRWTG